jgi:hypothetical protein
MATHSSESDALLDISQPCMRMQDEHMHGSTGEHQCCIMQACADPWLT